MKDFVVKFDEKTIGYLQYEHGIYSFWYVDNPIIKFGEFADIAKIYRSRELFLSFESRLPDINRKDFDKVCKDNNIDKYDRLSVLEFTKGKLATDKFTIEICNNVILSPTTFILKEHPTQEEIDNFILPKGYRYELVDGDVVKEYTKEEFKSISIPTTILYIIFKCLQYITKWVYTFLLIYLLFIIWTYTQEKHITGHIMIFILIYTINSVLNIVSNKLCKRWKIKEYIPWALMMLRGRLKKSE